MINQLISLISGGWLTLATLIGKIFHAHQQKKYDDRVAEGAIAKAKIEGGKHETKKVNAAIDAGNNDKLVHVKNDKQDRSRGRKRKRKS